MYGSASWVWQKKNESRIDAVKVRSLRNTCRVSLKDSGMNIDVREWYLLENGADPGAVNYDGELPIDLTENKSMQTILQKNINEKGIDCNAARKAEVNSLLADAKHWASNGYVEVRDLKTGGTPLHVAAAKGYNQVLQILLEQCKLDPDCVDYEGWTPLHAAALWSQKESAALLLKYGADPNIKNFSGQTCMDLVDPKLAPWLTSAISEAQATTRVNNNNIHKRKLTPPKLEVKRQDLDRVPEIVNMPNDKNNSTEKICDAKPPKGLPAAPETVIDENQNADETPSWRRSASFRTKQNDASQDNKTSASGDNGPAADGDIILRRTHSFENDRTFYERYRDVTARIKASSCPSIPPLPQSTIAGVESRKKLLEQISNANHPNSPTENTNDDVQARIGTPEKIERESNSTPSATNNTAPTAVRSARWVPKCLRRLTSSGDFRQVRIFVVSRDNIDEIGDRIVTVVKPVCQYDPESKQESMQWTKKRKAAEEIQGSKVGIEAYGDNFWDSEGVLLIDYLPKGTTMNGQYYANLLAQAREAVVQKRRGKLSRGVLFLQDNASVHTARVSRQALKDTGFSEIDHQPYSPDLAPSDYFLFSNLKKELRGRRFVDDNQMKMAVESHLTAKKRNIFWAV
ncbi:Protein phosphatase 1 regulatory subunit 12A [Eumeta japonica]|uniref:Protein phosphatase 1 regulatory subunit 12A n=1 Tax=Eumeta variegata TaxID=151549 RepID=A0A4C2A1K8_EUMVA|nr:Protein phosphatase 1 regulatory subunit 12A [Eumeta japonica]